MFPMGWFSNWTIGSFGGVFRYRQANVWSHLTLYCPSAFIYDEAILEDNVDGR